MAPTNIEPPTLEPPTWRTRARWARAMAGDAALCVLMPAWVLVGFDGGYFRRLNVWIYLVDAPMLWVILVPPLVVWLLARALRRFKDRRWRHGLAMLLLPFAIAAYHPGDGYPGDAAPAAERAAWAHAAYGAGWDAAVRAIATAPAVAHALGQPLVIAPLKPTRYATYGFMEDDDRRVHVPHRVEVTGPRGKAVGEIGVNGHVGDRGVPVPWGEPGPGELQVQGTLDGMAIERTYPLAQP